MNNLHYLIIAWIGAALLLIMGVYSMRKKDTPVWIGLESNAIKGKITNIPAYNQAVGKMWCLLSIPLFIVGIIIMWRPIVSVVVFCVFCTAGIGGCVWWYHKIEEKYTVK